MKSIIKSYAIAIVIGVLFAMLLIRPLMTSTHGLDDHAANTASPNSMHNDFNGMFTPENINQTVKALLLGVGSSLFLNYFLRSKRSKPENDN